MSKPGTKMAPIVDPSPMPVLLTSPTPDDRCNDEPTVRVVPGLIRLGSKPYRLKEVVWLNETGGDATFTFDAAGAAKFFDLRSKGPGPFTIRNGEKLALPISPSAPENSIYFYEVDCAETPNRPAQGNSSPQMSCP
jgi:hypothetical protein